jgi:hypothetical protein
MTKKAGISEVLSLLQENNNIDYISVVTSQFFL